MKNFKRKLAGLLVFAMVLGIMAPGVVAQAEGETPVQAGYEIDYEEEVINFTLGTASAIQYAEASAYDDVKTWDGPDAGDGRVDISWVKKNKDVTLQYRFLDENAEPGSHGSITLKAQKSVYKVALIATATAPAVKKIPAVTAASQSAGGLETGYIIVYDGKGSEGVIESEKVEWKKGANGEWRDASDLEGYLPKYKAKGATLYFRVKADNAWPSKEVKFSYKKQANAPKLKADVSKLTIGLKAGQEYQVVNQNDGKWINPETDMKLGAKEIKALTIPQLWSAKGTTPGSGTAIDTTSFYNGEPLKIKVRTAANSAKGTIPSKTFTLTVTASTMASISDAGIKLGYDSEQGGYTITNNDKDNEYEYAFAVSEASIKMPTKWTKLKKNPGTPKTIVVKDAKATANGTDLILIRKAGVKGNDKKSIKEYLASKYEKEELATIKANGATTLSGASIDGTNKDKFDAPVVDVDKFTVTVSGSAVSGAATKVDIKIDMQNLSTKVTKITAPKAIGDAKITATKLEKGTATISIELPEGKSVSNQKAEITFGKTKVDLTVNIAAAK